MNKILKWLMTIIGVILFAAGLIMKISEKPSGYEEFIAGNSYILLIIGLEAILLNFAFNHILCDDAENNKE